MDFIVPPTMTTGGIPWEKVLPPRLNGSHGYYNWSPSLLIPETDNVSSAEVGHLLKLTVYNDLKLFREAQAKALKNLLIFKSNLTFVWYLENS